MDLEQIKNKLEKSIGNGLYKHCLRTADEALKLANHYGENANKAYIAGILHDCGKHKSTENDNLMHSHIGAELAKSQYEILDENIINSIKYHTTGRENMSMLEKIIFIADKIEPCRNYEGVHEIRKLAYDNINISIIESIKSTIEYVKQKGFELDQQSVKTLDYLSNGGNNLKQYEKNIEIILKACDNKKGYNFVILDVSKISSITDYFIICSGNNERQTVAIADEVIDKAGKEGIEFHYKEGFDTGRWILLVTDNIIVHIFHKDERDIYDLESLWFDNNSIDVEQYGINNWK